MPPSVKTLVVLFAVDAGDVDVDVVAAAVVAAAAVVVVVVVLMRRGRRALVLRFARLFVRLGVVRAVYVKYVKREYEHFVVYGERAVQHVLVIAIIEAQRVHA